MEGNEKQMKKKFLDVTDIYCILTYKFWIKDTKTLAGAISKIHMQFALKWDQAMLCLDNFYIS